MDDPFAAAPAAPLPHDLVLLATEAGIKLEWADFLGRPKCLTESTVRRTLTALGLPNADGDQIEASRALVHAGRSASRLRTARVNGVVAIEWHGNAAAQDIRGTLRLEWGETRDLSLAVDDARIEFAVGDQPGYHRVEIDIAGEPRCFDLAVAPLQAFGHDIERCWGTAVQLYSLRAEADRCSADAGTGDYSALAAFAVQAGRAGARAVAVSPTHAGFAAQPSRYSPYSPSSRLFHNVLYIDPVAEFGRDVALAAAQDAGLGEALEALSTAALIDWERSGTTKLRWLRAVFDQVAVHGEPEEPSELESDSSSNASNDALRRHATFEALHAHFLALSTPHWRDWPADFHDPDGAAVAGFAITHATEVRFHAWLQNLASRGLARAQAAAIGAGMSIGVIADLAIGMAGDGSHAWAAQREVTSGLEVGAPPDLLNTRGQGWGLATFSPSGLRACGFAPFIATLRAAMAHAGGVRIDHVLGLRRLWLIPVGMSPADGAYVEFPFEDMLNLVVLESHRHRALVIGEDLGTVPPGFAESMAERGIFGMSVLWFERNADDDGFSPPEKWRATSIAMTTTHDLPTAAGWWAGRDVDWRHRLGVEAEPERAHSERALHREALGVLAPHVDPGADGIELAIEIVAQARSPLAIVPIEDLLGLEEQPNFPGTTDEHPNWRQRLPLATDQLFASPQAQRGIARLNVARPPRAPSPPSAPSPLIPLITLDPAELPSPPSPPSPQSQPHLP